MWEDRSPGPDAGVPTVRDGQGDGVNRAPPGPTAHRRGTPSTPCAAGVKLHLPSLPRRYTVVVKRLEVRKTRRGAGGEGRAPGKRRRWRRRGEFRIRGAGSVRTKGRGPDGSSVPPGRGWREDGPTSHGALLAAGDSPPTPLLSVLARLPEPRRGRRHPSRVSDATPPPQGSEMLRGQRGVIGPQSNPCGDLPLESRRARSHGQEYRPPDTRYRFASPCRLRLPEIPVSATRKVLRSGAGTRAKAATPHNSHAQLNSLGPGRLPVTRKPETQIDTWERYDNTSQTQSPPPSAEATPRSGCH